MTIEEFDARLEASNLRRAAEIEKAQARNRELEELLAEKKRVLARLQTAVEQARRDSAQIDARVSSLSASSRRDLRQTSKARLSVSKSSAVS